MYTGEFSNDLPNGKGVLTQQSGDVYEGQFEEGCMIEGKIKYKNG